MSNIESLWLILDNHHSLSKSDEIPSDLFLNKESLTPEQVNRARLSIAALRRSWEISTIISPGLDSTTADERLKLAQALNIDQQAEVLLRKFDMERWSYLRSHLSFVSTNQLLEGQKRKSSYDHVIRPFYVLPSDLYALEDMHQEGVKVTVCSTMFDNDWLLLQYYLGQNRILPLLRSDYFSVSLRTRIPRDMKDTLPGIDLTAPTDPEHSTHHSPVEHKFHTNANAKLVAQSEGTWVAWLENDPYEAVCLGLDKTHVFVSISRAEFENQLKMQLEVYGLTFPSNLSGNWERFVHFNDDVGFSVSSVYGFLKNGGRVNTESPKSPNVSTGPKKLILSPSL